MSALRRVRKDNTRNNPAPSPKIMLHLYKYMTGKIDF